MTCSAARLEANRRNAQRSTGPKTPEGKATSRQNATRHGGAAADDLLGPLDDAGLVAERAAALAEEWGATGKAECLLTRRAALLSVRMERLAERDEAATQARMTQAVAEADAQRRRLLDRLIAELHHVGPERALARDRLEALPDGVDRLLGFAARLRDALSNEGDPASTAAACRQAQGWLDPAAPIDSGDPTSPDAATLAAWRVRVAAEVARLHDRADELAPARAGIDAERRRVALAAAFDPSAEAGVARRYEQAAERGFYRALQAIRQLRRDGEAPMPAPMPTPGASAPNPAPADPAPTPAVAPPPAPAPTPENVDAAPRAVGSFRRAGQPAPFALVEPPPLVLPQPLVDAPARRRGRPNPARLAASRR